MAVEQHWGLYDNILRILLLYRTEKKLTFNFVELKYVTHCLKARRKHFQAANERETPKNQ